MLPLPLTLTIIALVCLAILQFAVDTARRRRVETVKGQLLALGQKHAHRSISVIVKAGGRQEQVTTLLDHLRRQSYEDLQTVVVPRNRSNKRATSYLQAYKREHPKMNLRIVGGKGRMTERLLVAKQARGELVIWIDLDDRLPHGFFERVSYEFADPLLERLEIPYIIRPSQSIGSMAYAWTSVRRTTLSLLLKKFDSRVPTMPVILRVAYLKNSSPQVKRLARLSFGLTRRYETKPNDWIASLANIALAAAVTATLISIRTSEWFFMVLAVIAIYATLNLLWIMPLRGFSAPERMVLILGLPFSLAGGNKSRKK